MELFGLIFIIAIIIIFIETSAILFLVYNVGNNREKKLYENLNRIINGIGSAQSLIEKHEKTSSTRNTGVKSQLYTMSMNLQNSFGEFKEGVNSQIGRVEKTISSSSNNIIRNIEQARDVLNNNNDILNELKKELHSINSDLRKFKNELLNSFKHVDQKMDQIQSTQHGYLSNEFQILKNEQANSGVTISHLSFLLDQHLGELEPIRNMMSRLENLYNQLILLDKSILNEENKFNGMVDKHLKVVEYTKDLSKTSKDIFDLIKLLLMDSIVERTKI